MKQKKYISIFFSDKNGKIKTIQVFEEMKKYQQKIGGVPDHFLLDVGYFYGVVGRHNAKMFNDILMEHFWLGVYLGSTRNVTIKPIDKPNLPVQKNPDQRKEKSGYIG